MEAARAYSASLLDRIGERHRQAARRRAWVKREEERMEEERRAYWHAIAKKIGKQLGELRVYIVDRKQL